MNELCPCQLGLCGACERGEHARCLTVQHGGPRRMAHTYLRSGFVLTRVYVGCRYLCPCPACQSLTSAGRKSRDQLTTGRKALRRKGSAAPDQDALF